MSVVGVDIVEDEKSSLIMEFAGIDVNGFFYEGRREHQLVF